MERFHQKIIIHPFPSLPLVDNKNKITVIIQLDPADDDEARLCLVPQNPIYQLYATIVAFYLPLIVILILNTQIYRIARKIINRVRGQSRT